jgi:hypothetical protein
MKVLFLDIDGVLNSAASAELHHRLVKQNSFVVFQDPPQDLGCKAYDFCPVAVANLNYLLGQVPDLQIVISSMWRIGRTLPELQAIFTYLGLPSARIIGQTPFHNDFGAVRGVEIKEWLTQHPEVIQYGIVDDDSDMLPEQLTNFFKTDEYLGLTYRDALKLVQHFSGQ